MAPREASTGIRVVTASMSFMIRVVMVETNCGIARSIAARNDMSTVVIASMILGPELEMTTAMAMIPNPTCCANRGIRFRSPVKPTTKTANPAVPIATSVANPAAKAAKPTPARSIAPPIIKIAPPRTMRPGPTYIAAAPATMNMPSATATAPSPRARVLRSACPRSIMTGAS